MRKRRDFRTAVLIAAVLLAQLVLAAPAFAKGERPSWHVGDFWEYSGWQTWPPTPAGSYRHRIEVEAITQMDVGGSRYEAYGLVDTWTFPSGGIFLVRMWQTTNDLSTIRIENSLPVMFLGFCTVSPCSSTYGPPIPVYGFPLAQGKRWSAMSTRTVFTDSSNQTNTITITMVVSSEREVTVLLNESGQPVSRTFHTFEVALTAIQIGGSVYQYSPAALVLDYSDEVGLWIRVAQYYADGTPAGGYNLSGFQRMPTLYVPGSPWPSIGLAALVGGGVAAVAILVVRRRTRAPKMPKTP